MISNKKEKNQPIQVFVRVRPLNKQEGPLNIIDFNPKNNKELYVRHHGHTKTYTFDRVFQPISKQIDVYKLVAAPTVAEVISGYNCTVLAYGQTGTGKTYTMAGGTPDTEKTTNVETPPWMEDIHAGIIPRTLAHLFDELRVQQLEFTVRVSYLELYNEEIFDLLSPLEDTTKLKLYDDSMKKGSVIVQGLTETTVNTKADVYKILDKGAEKRRIAATQMNAQSSRSHTVFCITVHTKENSIDGEDLLKTGKLYLVDLAGSENIKQSGATDIRAREAFNINQSLLTLGRCINKLTERATHIPYRESKLTRLLQDSLGGRTKTTLIATVSPAFCNVDETLNTLDYAFRAKSITNKPEINQRLSKKTLLKEYTEEIERLRKDLMATKRGTGIYLDEENYASLTQERDTHKAEIAEKINVIRMLEEEMLRKEELLSQLKFSLEEHQKDVQIKTQTINTLESQLKQASTEITNLSEENEIKEYIVQKYSETEEALKTTAKELLSVADTTTSDTKKLHDKLDVLGDIQKHNKMICEQQMTDFNQKIDNINDKLRNLQDHQYNFHQNLFDSVNIIKDNIDTFKKKTREVLLNLKNYSNDSSNIQCDTCVEFSESQEQLRTIQDAVSVTSESQLKQLDRVFEEDTKVKLANLFNFMDQQEEFIAILLNNTNEMISKNFTQVTDHVNSSRQMLHETKSMVDKHIDNAVELCQKAQQNVKNATKVEQENQQVLEQKMNNILLAMKEFQTSAGDYFKLNNEKAVKSSKDLHEIEDFNLKGQEDLNEQFDKLNTSIDNFATAFETSTEDNKKITSINESKKINQTSEKVKSKSKVEKSTYKFKESSYIACQEIVSDCKSKLNEQILSDENKCSNFKNRMDGLTANLEHVHEEFSTEIKNTCETVDTKSDKITDNTKECEKVCSEIESSVTTDLDNCREGFRKLYSSSLKEYKQTGQTPQRRFYKYPRTLIETQPKEKLIEEYQKVRSTSATPQNPEEKENENEPEFQSKTYVRSSSESNIPRILKENGENRSFEKSSGKIPRRQFYGDENIEYNK